MSSPSLVILRMIGKRPNLLPAFSILKLHGNPRILMRFDAAGMRHIGDSTEWQCPLSDIHSIMMEKSAQPGVSGRCSTPSLSLYQPPRAKLRGQIHSPYFYSTPIFTLWKIALPATLYSSILSVVYWFCEYLIFSLFSMIDILQKKLIPNL
jgi:hypothetical protein